MVASGACGGGAARRGRTVVFASGAELQSMNPLVTIHPLAKQVQRYVLLTTLARYDTALVPRPYLARMWVWSPVPRPLPSGFPAVGPCLTATPPPPRAWGGPLTAR